MSRAALYLRSSKDRHDASVDAQRRALRQMSVDRGLTIVAEFVDVVESGKDENRPGFQQLLAAMRDPRRGWATLLALDTSRIARRRHIAIVFEEVEAKRHGVRVVYKSLPDSDPITEMLLKSILQAMDEWHSLTSRAKGLAGMSENVRKGYRAGGRAPVGYRLERIDTGAIREGAAVTKSRLVPGEEFDRMSRYLRARAAGVPRSTAARQAGVTMALSSLVGVDWNALTYAGATVWNVHAEHQAGQGYKGQRKRRPRAEWVIQNGTHEAAISLAQAEAILAAMESNEVGEAIRRAKTAGGDYLLTGLLVAPDGRAWEGSHRKHYRLRGAGRGANSHVRIDDVDRPIVARLVADMRSPRFLAAMVATAKRTEPRGGAAGRSRADLQREIIRLNDQISRAMDAALKLADPAPAYRKIDEVERKRRALAEEQARVEEEEQIGAAVQSMTAGQIEALLAEWADRIERVDRADLKRVLRMLVDRIVLDPGSLDCRIEYRIHARNPVDSRVSMAFPRGFDRFPALVAVSRVRIPRRVLRRPA